MTYYEITAARVTHRGVIKKFFSHKIGVGAGEAVEGVVKGIYGNSTILLGYEEV